MIIQTASMELSSSSRLGENNKAISERDKDVQFSEYLVSPIVFAN